MTCPLRAKDVSKVSTSPLKPKMTFKTVLASRTERDPDRFHGSTMDAKWEESILKSLTVAY